MPALSKTKIWVGVILSIIALGAIGFILYKPIMNADISQVGTSSVPITPEPTKYILSLTAKGVYAEKTAIDDGTPKNAKDAVVRINDVRKGEKFTMSWRTIPPNWPNTNNPSNPNVHICASWGDFGTSTRPAEGNMDFTVNKDSYFRLLCTKFGPAPNFNKLATRSVTMYINLAKKIAPTATPIPNN